MGDLGLSELYKQFEKPSPALSSSAMYCYSPVPFSTNNPYPYQLREGFFFKSASADLMGCWDTAAHHLKCPFPYPSSSPFSFTSKHCSWIMKSTFIWSSMQWEQDVQSLGHHFQQNYQIPAPFSSSISSTIIPLLLRNKFISMSVPVLPFPRLQ